MQVKPGSAECIAPRGNTESASGMWQRVDCLKALGHWISHDGSITKCWAAARSAMRKAFWTQASHMAYKSTSTHAKLRIVERILRPQLLFRAPRWPASQGLEFEIDREHRRFISWCLDVQWSSGDTPESYAKKRCRMAARVATQQGLWSVCHCRAILTWADHLARHGELWPACLLHIITPDDLNVLRAQRHPGSGGTKTGTRNYVGHVYPRWQERLQYASDLVLVSEFS